MERQTPVHSDLVTTPGSHRRSGFTLVELLAVIMIIALLAGLVTPAVMRAMSSARTAAVKAEIDLLHMALVNYKNEYGSFPPADMRGLWNGSAVNQNHAAYKHLQRIFPRISEPTNTGEASPYYWMSQMSPAQALVFWLQGFYDNPQYPLTNGIPINAVTPRSGDSGGSRKGLFDFDEARLIGANAYFLVTSTTSGLPISTVPTQTFMTRNNPAIAAFDRDYPVYFPKQANTGLPYVYFPASTYNSVPAGSVPATLPPPTTSVLYYQAKSTTGNDSYVSPYFDSSPPSQPSWAQLHANADSFQLIAAGADGTYGNVIAAFPAAASKPNGSTIPISYGLFPSVIDEINAAGHADNITNFANGTLKEAAAKLLNP